MLDSNLPAVADTLQTLAQNSSKVSPGLFVRIMQIFSIWLIPVLIFTILILAWRNKVKVYEAFIDGAKEGFSVAIKIIPYLVAILVAIGMFRASGAMDIFVALFSPITNLIGMPAETLPVALMRPLSGSGALGLVTELMKQHGPDSFIGRVASTMWGSTETTFYVVAVYFGSVGVRRVRHSVTAGLVGDAAGLIMAVIICRLVFG
ncbi:MAG: spore maturation protein [Candidatus Marinimicrobia bacterium]|nr:spore maturation protein [Candidatus Neomarinimicrobiota bacterium]